MYADAAATLIIMQILVELSKSSLLSALIQAPAIFVSEALRCMIKKLVKLQALLHS